MKWMFKLTDSHNASHFLGCFGITMTLTHCLPAWLAFNIALLLGVAWEFIDEINYRKNLMWKIFDPRGGDIGDVFIDILGAGLAWVLYWGMV